jgi:two-component system, chemotaxis family, chemotaxis protein CheY
MLLGAGGDRRGRHRDREYGTTMSKIILAVDDSASMRQMISVTLRGAGYHVVEAADGEAALEYARKHPVDLVLADVNMPGIDGITLVAQLRTLPAYHLTPLLLLTTESSHERKMQGKQAGATGWMVKPFNPVQLLATLERVLGNPVAAG